MGEMIDLKIDSRSAKAYLALPEQGEGPGVLLMHAWWGLTDFFKQLADRLSAEGFVVLATDVYGGKTATSIEDAGRLMEELNYREGVKTLLGAADYLVASPAVKNKNIGVVGFSMGAGYAGLLSTLMPEITAVVLFYGGAEQEENFASETHASFLGHFAEHDDYEPEELVPRMEEQLLEAGREARFYVYPNTGHWFFESNRPDVYNADAARVAWNRTIEFLHAKLG